MRIGDHNMIDLLLFSGANHSILNKELKTPVFYADYLTKDNFKLWKLKT